MTAIRRRLLYGLVVLLFLLVIAMIGWLAHMLFAFRVVAPASEPVPVVFVRHQQAAEGPFSETVIDIDAPPGPTTDSPRQDETIPGAGDTAGAAGHIPFVCEGYGPQIQSREAFPNPLTHETVVSATRAVVTLTLPPSLPRGDQ